MPFPATPGSARPGQLTPGDPGAAPPPNPVVNQWSGTLYNDSGLAVVPVANHDGNSLVAYIGWNTETFPSSGYVTVADDAHNYWQPLGIAPQTAAGVRTAIYIAANADPATVVCVSSALPVSSMAVSIVEFQTMPVLAVADFNPNFNGVAGTSINVSATATQADWAFAMAASDNNTTTLTAPGGVWTALTPVGLSDPFTAEAADIKIVPVYAKVNAGALSATFTSGAVANLNGTLAGILQSPASVTNPKNPNWPVFTVQAAFGFQPGSGNLPQVWTDISSRAIWSEADAILDVQAGRSYELTGPEAGTIRLWLSNTDGALTPGNSSSPYYPNVLPQTPIRITATWNNEIYPVASGSIDKWPQTFPAPQWPMTNVSASDPMGVLANLTLHSAYQSEVLLDQPYAYWPLGESYGSANGLPFQNLGSALTNYKPMVGYDGQSVGSQPLATGLTLNLAGDTGSGIGLSGLSANPAGWSSGAIYIDPGLANAIGSGALTVEFVASVPTTGTFTTPLVSILGAPTNFGSGGGPVRFQAAVVSGSPYHMRVTIANFTGSSWSSSVFSCPNDGNLHHHVFTVGTTTVTHYLDGGLDTTATSTVSIIGAGDSYQVALGPALITPLTSNPFNYTLAHVALWGRILGPARVLLHANIAQGGAANESAQVRFKRIMAWSQSYLPMASTLPSAAPLMGAAFTVGGQAGTDALNDLVVSEGGWPYADASGNTWWAGRASFYNRAPKWTFGDNPANNEIPYDPGQGFDFDNAYLYTTVQAVRQVGQTTQITTNATEGTSSQTFLSTGAQVQVASAAARLAYGNRNSLQQTMLTYYDQDPYDRAFWSQAKYSASSFRVPQITIDAASNASLWPVVLGAEQGDVVKVIRRPLGAAAYTMLGIVVQKHLEVGMNKGQVTLGIVPYSIEANIIHVDDPNYDTLANGIGW